MAVVYATLIIKGKKTFAQVPATLKEQVRQILIRMDIWNFRHNRIIHCRSFRRLGYCIKYLDYLHGR